MRSAITKYTIALSILLAVLACGGPKPAEQAAPEPAAPAAAAPETTEAAPAEQPAAAPAGSYEHSLAAGDMQLQWTVNGDQLDVQVAAPTTGWVGVGFNPESGMKGANIIIGSVKDGQATVQDHFGTLKTNHKPDEDLGGSSQLSNIGGSEENGITTLSFSLPLDSGDANDSVLDPAGTTMVLLAYGKSDVMVLKHKAHAILEVTLATGDHQLVRIDS